jgi:hypothetical protein
MGTAFAYISHAVYNFNDIFSTLDGLCGIVVRVPGYRTEMYCVSCEVRIEFMYAM